MVRFSNPEVKYKITLEKDICQLRLFVKGIAYLYNLLIINVNIIYFDFYVVRIVL